MIRLNYYRLVKLNEYYINNQKNKALELLKFKDFDNNMFKELLNIKKIILNFDDIARKKYWPYLEIKKDNFKLLKTKLLYDFYIKSNQLDKAKQIQIKFK